MSLSRVVCFVTYRCNLACAFCVRRALPMAHAKERPPEDWIEALATLAPDWKVAITGGEPSIYKGVGELLDGVSPRQWTLDSNCEVHPSTYVSEDAARRGFFFNASLQWHPRHPRAQAVWSAVEWTVARGIATQVTHVALERDLPEQWEEARRMTEERGASFYLGTFDDRFIWKHRPLPRQYKRVAVCSGGNSFLAVAPDGTAYRCMGHLYDDYAPLGNIFTAGADAVRMRTDAPCTNCVCTACDFVTMEGKEELD